MAWSKTAKTKKPIGWWYHKVLCEFGYSLRNYTYWGWSMYYKHLSKMCNKYKINLYGDKII
jgi:hypothetical protein